MQKTERFSKLLYYFLASIMIFAMLSCGCGKKETGIVYYSIVGDNGEGVPAFASADILGKPSMIVPVGTKFTVLETKKIEQDAFLLEDQYSLMQINTGGAFKYLVSNNTIIFKVKGPAVNPNRIYQKGSLISLYTADGGLKECYIRILPEDMGKHATKSLKGLNIHKVKLANGNEAWLYGGFAVIGPDAEKKVEEAKKAAEAKLTAPHAGYMMTSFKPGLVGTWKDAEGKDALVLTSNTINGSKLWGIYDVAGGGSHAGGKIDYIANGKNVSTTIIWELQSENKKFLTLGDKNYYRIVDKHTESISGIYLTMTKAQVSKTLGKPSSQTGNNGNVWSYDNGTFTVEFDKGIVSRISLHNGCKRVFDKSKLGYGNTPAEYKSFYKDASQATERIIINAKESEYIWFFGNQIQLNGYGF